MTSGHDSQESARLEAFSDGVFAIAITLLILELKVPHPGEGPLRTRLAEQWPSYAAFLTSFATIGIMWLNHHRVFQLIRRVDHGLLVVNGLLLLGVSIVPFPTALMAAYLGRPEQTLAAIVYSATYVYIAIAFNALWRYASSPKRTPSLLNVPHDGPEVRAIHAQYRFGPLFYVASLLLALWSASAAMALNMGFALFFAIPPRSVTKV
jgi:TMEM175 potassium channel family protein